MRNEAEMNYQKLLKRVKKEHDEVCRALASDRTVVESLDKIVLSLQESIEQNKRKKIELDNDIYSLGDKKDEKSKEVEKVIEELNKWSLMVENAREEAMEIERKIGVTMADFESQQDKLLREIAEGETLFCEITEKNKNTIKDEIEYFNDLIMKRNKIDEMLKANKLYLSDLGLNIHRNESCVDKLEEIKKEYNDLDNRKYYAERETKIAEQKLEEEKLRLKELRKNKDGKN